MTVKPCARMIAATCLALLATTAIRAQDAPQPYQQPELSQRGKDVAWLPSLQAMVDRMLDMADVKVDDYVVDLGSGDGITVITAARRGAKALGIEYAANLVALSKKNAEAAGVGHLATFVQGDLFETDFSDATVVTLFLDQDLNERLRPTILEMKPNTRVVSNTWSMGDWMPDNKTPELPGCRQYCKASFWIVPAKVEGVWQLPEGELHLKQRYQMITGSIKFPTGEAAIANGRMQGDQITFSIGDRIYRGRVSGNTMEGAFGTETKWQATGSLNP